MEPADFRAPAIRATQALLARHPAPRDPRQLPFSACIEIDPNGRAAQRRIAVVSFAIFGVGLALFLATGVIALATQNSRAPTWQTTAALAGVVPAIACMFLVSVHAKIATRRAIWRRYASRSDFDAIGRGRAATIEQGGTFGQFKAITEDQGVYWVDLHGRRVVIEGLRCLYVVHAADVIRLGAEAGGGTKAVRITYAIGDVALSIAISDTRVLDHLKTQTVGLRQPGLLGVLEAALAPRPETNPPASA